MASRWRKRLQKMARKVDTDFTTYKRYEIAYHGNDRIVVFKDTNKFQPLSEVMIASNLKRILTATYCAKHKIKRVIVHDEDYVWGYSW